MHLLFHQHIAALLKRYEDGLARLDAMEGVLLHSGKEEHYYADDQAVPFQAFGHFCQWLPVNRPDQLVLVIPGRRPVYFLIVPPDYWYDQSIDLESWWADEFEIVRLSSREQLASHLPHPHRLAFLGAESGLATSLGIADEHVNPQPLLACLDYWRGIKTDYEIEQIRTANRLALDGHRAARECFLSGGSEFAVHLAYLQACGLTDAECPYTSIVAMNEKAAILHYQHKRRTLPAGERGQVLLIDAGHRVNGYCSDITRTTVADGGDDLFKALLTGMEAIKQRLVQQVRPGLAYLDIHRAAMEQIAELAIETGLVTASLDEALRLNLAGLFMPHGVGHLLGIQVHDVGGHQQDTAGRLQPPPREFPFLRNTRVLEQGMVFTIEPGFYLIPLLLNPQRDSNAGHTLNWRLIDRLLPLGGIRVEDNVAVTADGVENLTQTGPVSA